MNKQGRKPSAEKCSVCGEQYFAMGFCKKHYYGSRKNTLLGGKYIGKTYNNWKVSKGDSKRFEITCVKCGTKHTTAKSAIPKRICEHKCDGVYDFDIINPHQQDILNCYLKNDYNYKKTAEIMVVNPNTVVRIVLKALINYKGV